MRSGTEDNETGRSGVFVSKAVDNETELNREFGSRAEDNETEQSRVFRNRVAWRIMQRNGTECL